MSFKQLLQTNVSKYVETKGKLKYLSWTYAWSEFKKIYEDAEYKVHFFDGKPYIYDENLGYMVYTTVKATVVEYLESHEMWLCVMDGSNKAMKSNSYTYEVKDWETGGKKTKPVESATMFDINKTIMRCLVKNIAMFGLGLYIYNGEDLPPEPSPQEKQDEKNKNGINWVKNILSKVNDEEIKKEVWNQMKNGDYVLDNGKKLVLPFQVIDAISKEFK